MLYVALCVFYQLAFTIEAGRRCDSGPGTFTFETQQAEKIFSLIQSTIKQKTSSVTSGNQNQEDERVIVTNIQAHSPLPKIPDMTSMTSILENKLRIQVKTSEESVHAEEDPVGSSECVSAQPAPITLMPLPLVPTHDSPSGGCHGDQLEIVYADPIDCIQSVSKPQMTTAMYVDPASVLPLHPPSSREPVSVPPNSSTPSFIISHPDSVYSEVYDKVSPVQNKPNITQSHGKIKCFADDEPIYTEPMSEKDSHKSETKPDPFAHLYAQVCKTPSSSSSSSSNTTPSFSASSSSSSVTTTLTTAKASDHSVDDVIYENLGVI